MNNLAHSLNSLINAAFEETRVQGSPVEIPNHSANNSVNNDSSDEASSGSGSLPSSYSGGSIVLSSAPGSPQKLRKVDPRGFPFPVESHQELFRQFHELRRIFNSKRPSDFFAQMPKGAETHAHNTASFLSPGIIMVWAKDHHLWLHTETFETVKPEEGTNFLDLRRMGYIPPAEFERNADLMVKFAAMLTMDGEHPGGLTGCRRFFQACKVGEGILTHVSLDKRVAEIAFEALVEKILYREDMIEMLIGREQRAELKKDLFSLSPFAMGKFSEYLTNQKFLTVLKRHIAECKLQLDRCDHQVPKQLKEMALQNSNKIGLSVEEIRMRFTDNCPLSSVDSPITYRYIMEICRTQPLEDFFIDAVASFKLAASDLKRVVGVNVVGREDDQFATQHFEAQLEILGKLRTEFPRVKLSMHCGELTTRHIRTSNLRGRLRQVIETLHPERLGHAFSIQFEQTEEQKAIIKLIQDRKIFVEGCPTSSVEIMGEVSPWVSTHCRELLTNFTINTDDALINRSSLSGEFLQVWDKGYRLDEEGEQGRIPFHYFMQWNRNGLESAFLEGKSLYVIKEGYYALIEEFHGMADPNWVPSVPGQRLLRESEKAKMQYRFEREMLKFTAKRVQEEMEKRVNVTSPCSKTMVAFNEDKK